MSLPPAAEPAAPARNWPHYTPPQVVQVDGVPTAYRRKGDGESVVYLHGGGLTRLWLPFLEDLSSRYDVIAPEHPGFGDTPRPETLDGFDDLVLHYDAFLQALDLEDVHLVGHSLGGWIAADLAVFYPRRFRSLTLITPTGLRLHDVPSIDVFRMLPDDMVAALFNGRQDQHADLLTQEGGAADLIQAFTESATAAVLSWNPRYDRKLDTRLARVRAPTLILGAEDDHIVPTPMAARFAELIPGARLVTPAGREGEPTGHLVHVERPQEIAALVGEHLDAA